MKRSDIIKIMKSKTTYCFVFFFLLVLLNIMSNVQSIPELHGYVTDEVGVVLYSDSYDDVLWVCDTLERETSCVLAILIVNNTDGQDISSYATIVFNENGIGTEGKDNGILIVVAVEDKSYFIAIGRGLESILNDAKVGIFAEESLVPYLQYGDYGRGIYLLSLDIGAEIEQFYEQSQSKEYPISWIPLELPQLFISIIVLGFIFVITRGKIIVWIGALLQTLGRGRSGGGGAGGRYN